MSKEQEIEETKLRKVHNLGAEFIRQGRVDISEYLPSFLQKDEEFKATCDAESFEHEKVLAGIKDVFNQLFVETATWGLTMYERILDLHPAPDATYEYRRAQILIHMQAAKVSTVEVMNAIVNTYGSGYIVEQSERYYFEVFCSCNDKAALKAMKEDILTYKPAHLGISIYLGYSWDGQITFDGTYSFDTTQKDWSDEV
ncbi:phage related protein (plasmid) [Selenomonas ruminantium subsp. lactilytica TAM6421]|uniref:Phage related protein n=1 Tax=Selenomonas ruminantium subsp. lactilytica (strain NBRC 103574 / TAM6421) TaxID=927704 RepID=I0GWS5_SELRL|nr:putative phage tail protein [Selenomonas ruminantium]BAL85212.1 phage related protein [Selenomonas ruminantium subsp. lactilytica TAM6421]